MSDYEKFTVIKLRDELIARGLPKTGLKAALVQRLIEADAESEKANSAANEPAANSQEDESVTKAVLPGPQALREPQDDDNATADTPQSEEQDKIELKDADKAAEDAPRCEPDELMRRQSQTGEVQREEIFEQQRSDSLTQPSGYVVPKGAQSEALFEDPNESAEESEPEVQLPTPNQTQCAEVQAAKDNPAVSTQTWLTGDEFLQDSRKRKRRSQSPPPSPMEKAQKRVKADHARSHTRLSEDLELPEDSMAGHISPGERHNDVSPQEDPTFSQKSDTQTNGHTYSNGESKLAKISTSAIGRQTDVEGVSHSQADSFALEERGLPKKRSATPTQAKSVEPPMRSSPSDTRFKNLFTAPASLEPSSQQSHYPDAEDKIVSPALHPATSALYIRELMRPLKIESLRDHLTALATPSDTPFNPDIVTDFFLDSVRTHCLVGFENISAASRVRSGLHDRVWPNERDRRQLWVDFVPEEKLKKWINVEQTAGGGRGQPSKRWEVVYEDEENGIKAYLQESGSNGGGLRAAQPPRVDAGRGVQVLPLSGPRTSEPELRSSQPRLDSGKGFRALDDLFTSTAAKPKLYYLPVSKAEADRRLTKLAAGRGGGRGDEMRRFSFEEGSIVDNGPEFGRGGYGRGGGYSGSYRGRGRGYTTNASRGDSWKDRRSEY